MDIDWNTLSSQPNGIITDSFIQKFNNTLNFDLLVKNYVFSSFLITTFFYKLNFKYLIRNQNIDELVLRNYSSCFDPVTWAVISHYQPLSTQFLKDFNEKLKIKTKPLQCYDILTVNGTFTFQLIDIEHFNGTCYEKTKLNQFTQVDLKKVNWTFYIKNIKISESQLRKITKYFDEKEWTILPKYYNLSLDFKKDFFVELHTFDGFLNKSCYPNISCLIQSNTYMLLLIQFFTYLVWIVQ